MRTVDLPLPPRSEDPPRNPLDLSALRYPLPAEPAQEESVVAELGCADGALAAGRALEVPCHPRTVLMSAVYPWV